MEVAKKFFDLGTEIVVAVRREEDLPGAVLVVKELAKQVDFAASRFKRDSELGFIMRDGKTHGMSPLLKELIYSAVWAEEVTDGLVDPTVGASLEALGYDRDFSKIVAMSPRATKPCIPPGRDGFEVDFKRGTLRIKNGVIIDLGATGKAKLSDLAAEKVLKSGVKGVLVSCGGDIALAGEAPESGWAIRMSEDCTLNQGPIISLFDGGLATSSTTVRKWKSGKDINNHLVNPKTGGTVNGPWRTISVAAEDCLAANTASTAAMVLGSKAVAWLEERKLPARLVAQSGEVTLMGAWPEGTEK